MENKPVIILAGANGKLGATIAQYLVLNGATVKALLRSGSKLPENYPSGFVINQEVDYSDPKSLARACENGTCIISALSGVEDTIVDAQMKLLKAAESAGVQRFIPSDYCVDYRNLPYGQNRNLDFRKKFFELSENTKVQLTSVLSGMFMDLLAGQAPVILSKVHKILYWGNDRQLLDFTTMDNTAEFTALTALQKNSPRWLSISGDTQSPYDLKKTASSVTGHEFTLFRAGSLKTLRRLSKMVRFIAPGKRKTFPPWQGMQYLHDMLSGQVRLLENHNNRFPQIQWTSIKEFLTVQQMKPEQVVEFA